jgi:hypothetical protein
MEIPKVVNDIAEAAGGKIDSIGRLPDGSGFATMSMPLPADHWLTQDHENIPPMPLRLGVGDSVIIIAGGRTLRISRVQFNDMLRAAGRYAVRCATLNGKEDDFDPDALIQNLIVGFLGYHTDTGLSSDAEANPRTP